MASYDTYDLGDPITLAKTFTDAAGNPVDPTTVTLEVRRPSGVWSEVVVTTDGVGVRSYDFTGDSSGVWRWKWSATGAGADTETGAFVVGGSNYEPVVAPPALDVLAEHESETEGAHGLPVDPTTLETVTGAQAKADAARGLAEAYADAQVAGLVDTAPGALDTLNELAAALGDDANFAATVTTSLATKAPQAALEAVDEATLKRSGAFLAHKLNGQGTEPAAAVVWTADDGYRAQAGFFDLLNSKGIKGTLFLTKNWVDQAGTNGSWNDTYITTAQVQAVVAAGHELATHGVNHEDYTAYFATNGAAALQSFIGGAKSWIETTFGTTVRTGAYPAGLSNTRVREIMDRDHEFYRGTKGVISRNPASPQDVTSIDVYNLTEAAIKAHVDTAVAERAVVVFLLHGWPPAEDATMATKLGNVMDYVTSIGVPQSQTFYEALAERAAIKGTNHQIDTQGNAFFPAVRSHRLELLRNDNADAYFFIDVDEATSAPIFDGPSTNNTPWEFKKILEFRNLVRFHGTETRFWGKITPSAIENMFQPASYTSDTEFLIRTRRAENAPTHAGVDLQRFDHRGKVYFRGPAAETLVQDVSGSTRASLVGSTTGPIKLWDVGTGTLRTGQLNNGVLSWT